LRRKDAPEIVRATAVTLLTVYGSPATDRARRAALEDPSPLVRAAAVRTLAADSGAGLLQQALPLLHDRVRIVRMAAATRLADAAPQLANSEFRDALDDAIAEFRAGQRLHLDRADAHMSLASLDEQLGDLAGAIGSFRSAIRVEPYRSGSRRELARLLEQVANDPGLAPLRATIKVDPDEIRTLRAQEVDPHYDRGLLLYLLGQLDAAREALEEATRISPTYYEAWMALLLICEKQQRWEDAAAAVKQLAKLQPDARDWREVLRRMQDTVRALEAEEAADAPPTDEGGEDPAD
jgi:tetratricopeptide (TPR) repeat protein